MSLSPFQDNLADARPLGRVQVPGSKSVSNRALLLAAAAPGWSTLRGGLEAEDTRWMRASLKALGVPMEEPEGAWRLQGGGTPATTAPLWLGASGTTLRFLLPWLAVRASAPIQMTGEARLFERPLEPLLRPLLDLGARWEPRPDGGLLHPCVPPPASLEVRVDAQLSSQFLTGLALAAASLPGGGTLHWDATSSASYLDLSARWLRAFGCATTLEPGRWRIPGGRLRPQSLDLPGDWSGAAAFLGAAAVLGRPLRLGPLDPDDPQGDRALPDMLARAGCPYRWTAPEELEVSGSLQRGFQEDLESCPDLGPVLAALAALAPGPSVLTGLHTLPLKECDRLEASADLVRWLGGRAEVEGDHTLRIWPGTPPRDRPAFDPRNDHRMAFAAAVGALRWGGDLLAPHCVAKTFPTFWETWARMLEGPAA